MKFFEPISHELTAYGLKCDNFTFLTECVNLFIFKL